MTETDISFWNKDLIFQTALLGEMSRLLISANNWESEYKKFCNEKAKIVMDTLNFKEEAGRK